jgi:uncharacterized glyoxalase superfamily protein PhnB
LTQSIGLVCVVVRDYDEAIAYYADVLGFTLIEDTPLPAQSKRWVVVAPGDGLGVKLLLAQASNDQQIAAIGNQTGGRVFLFLYTDNFEQDYAKYQERGVKFVREMVQEPYGTVAVFQDLYGNQWDLIQLKVKSAS